MKVEKYIPVDFNKLKINIITNQSKMYREIYKENNLLNIEV